MNAPFALLFVFLGFNLFAQDLPVTGKVLDSITLEPLPFTNIVIEGKKIGTVSNIEGYFVLDGIGIDENDGIIFSYMGYESRKFTIGELKESPLVSLNPAVLNLQMISVFSKNLTAEDIIERMRKNYEINYPDIPLKRKVFLHTYENTPWPETNRLNVNKSDFVGLDIQTLEDVFKELPTNFTEYKDAIVDFYHFKKKAKVYPIEGISMEEGSMKALSQLMESKLSDFLEDVQQTVQDEDVYYKFRSGIFATKADYQAASDTTLEAFKYDSAHYYEHTGLIRHQIQFLLKDYASIEGDNWEFIAKPGKYKYTLQETTVYDDELVYKITFVPTSGGLFEGVLYVSTNTFAILQMEYAYAAGKQDEVINLLGVSHAMNHKKGRVIFEKGDNGYFVKYIYANQKEFVAIDRSFSVSKREKRILIDKELNTIKVAAQLSFDIDSYWELLVIDQTKIDEQQFELAAQPRFFKFKREYVYNADMWQNGTVIAPAAELKDYKRYE